MIDPTVAVLRKIEEVSMQLDIRGGWITEDVNRLVNLPDWETNAEDKLQQAEFRLERTLQTVQQARALLARKRPQQRSA